MAIGLIGQKCGMTQVFTEEGHSVSVTVIEVMPNTVTQIKTKEKDGYKAVQVTTGTCKLSRLTKSLEGHFSKFNIKPGRGLWEFSLEEKSEFNVKIGDNISIDVFQKDQKVDVTAFSKGKGFAGVIKRHHFATQDATHGNSLSHRAPGSIGQRQSPGRVFKGKRMAGQLGNKKITIQSQVIVKLDLDKNLLFLKGGVPGTIGSNVIIVPSSR